jgi:hypothetical protein
MSVNGARLTSNPGIMIDPTHAPFSSARSTMTFNSEPGMRAVPSHRPLTTFSPRHTAATNQNDNETQHV